mmetsp:Transcript_13133/g.35973  ORF Transcript_13133/g.35973 Transcript_13133/m.35973 type:complete len:345 (+) Transcript_13133:54-1088(+)
MAAMDTMLVVKNTFICEVGIEALSPTSVGRPRAQTEQTFCRRERYLVLDDCEAAAELDVPTACGIDLVPELQAALALGGSAVESTVASILDLVGELVFHSEGCQLVHQALELASTTQLRSLVVKLRGAFRKAACCPHAHHLLLKLVHDFGAEVIAGIVSELVGEGSNLALDPFACAVLCSLFEFSEKDSETIALMDEVLASDVNVVCYHKHGHKVAVAMLHHGLPRHKSQILASLQSDAQRASRHRVAANVMVGALSGCDEEDAKQLAITIMSAPGAVKSLACHCFGQTVVRALLQLPDVSAQALQYLDKSKARLQRDRFGSLLLKELDTHPSLAVAYATRGGA